MAQPDPPQPPAAQIYNLDHEADFNACEARLKLPATGNFVVRFDNSVAECAVDVDQTEVLKWLQRDATDRPANKQALWLNFWVSESQRATIEAVAGKYDISPRLAGLMCPKTASTRDAASNANNTGTSGSSSDSSGGTASSSASTPKTPGQATDVELGIYPPFAAATTQGPGQRDSSSDLTFGNVVKKLWHFCSVDFGRHYIYVGFNSLFFLPEVQDQQAKPAPRHPISASFNVATGAHKEADTRPSGERIWSSLLICDDGTIISVFERPSRPEALLVARRNVLNVFHHLSRQHFEDGKQDALMKVRVRWNEHSRDATTASAGYDAREASSLLLYYLFDDWQSTYKLIARVEHPYRRRLQDMRNLMFEAAHVEHVKQVHEIGTQLTVLKLMYQSYELIVSRLLHSRRSARGASIALLSPQIRPDREFNPNRDTPGSELAVREDIFLDDETESNVKLSSSAVVRFERLLDRIRLYALTEIEECIKEKESLVLMVRSSPSLS
jgi:hypothetical protein